MALIDIVLSSLSLLGAIPLLLVGRVGLWLPLWFAVAGFFGVASSVLLLSRRRLALVLAPLAWAGAVGSSVCAVLWFGAISPALVVALSLLAGLLRLGHNVMYGVALLVALRAGVLR